MDDGDVGQVLEPGARIGAACISLAALGAGGVAVFQTANQAGCVALLGTGAVFGALAVTGQLINSVKVAGNEATLFARVGKRVTEVADTTRSPEVREILLDLIAETVTESSGSSSGSASAVAAIRYETEVVECLRRLSILTQVTGSLATPYDALARNGIAVIVKYRSAGRPPGLNALGGSGEIGRLVTATAGLPGVKRILVVTNSVIDREVSETTGFALADRAGRTCPVRLVSWNPNMADDALATVVRELNQTPSEMD